MEYVDSLISHTGFDSYVADVKLGRNLFIFHISPDNVISSPPYQSWMQRFGPKTQVIL